MVCLQYGFSYVFSDYYDRQMISDITDICMVFLQYGFSCVFSDHYLLDANEFHDITDILYGFSPLWVLICRFAVCTYFDT